MLLRLIQGNPASHGGRTISGAEWICFLFFYGHPSAIGYG